MKTVIRGIVVSCALALALPAAGYAHCDSMDGPVVKAAQRAIATGEVAHALIWVKAADEAEIKAAFAKTISVRKLGRDAEEMADRWFFETLVRVHRHGEGEPYTGLKPAGFYNDPAFVAADKALETGSYEAISEIGEHAAAKLRELHHAAVAAKKFSATDLEAGRAFVARYAVFVHYVEQLHHLIHETGSEHAQATSDPTRARVSVRDRR